MFHCKIQRLGLLTIWSLAGLWSLSAQTPPAANAPFFVASGVVSAAALTSDLAPGMVIAIEGRNLSSMASEAGALPLPTTLGGVQVLLNNVAIPLLLVSEETIHAQIPWEQAIGTVVLTVRNGRLDSGRVSVVIRRAAPGVILLEGGRAAMQNADGRFNSDTAQAAGGMLASLYAVGLGPVDARVTTGTASPAGRTTLPVTVTFSGTSAEVLSATLVEGMIGVYRILVRVPDVGYGVHPVRYSVDRVISNPGLATIVPVRPPTTDDWCLQAPVNGGEVILPHGATEVEVVEEDFQSGAVHSLYPNSNTGNDLWYNSLTNTSDGCPLTVETGQVPPPPPDPDEDAFKDLIEDPEANDAWNDTINLAATAAGNLNFDPTSGDVVRIVQPTYVYQRPADPCAAPPGQLRPDTARYCALLQQSPFAGKDIIFVHGLNLEVIKGAMEGTLIPGWGTGFLAQSIYTTYFQNLSNTNWTPHIQRFLVSRNAKNRYITAGYSSAAHLPYASNTLLYQIATAMTAGAGVKLLDSGDVRGSAGFCARGCVVISHSTGAPVFDVAMALATDAAYRSVVGPIQFIYQNITTHVAMGGAFDGSRYAAIAVGIGTGAVKQINLGCRVVNHFLDRDGSDCVYDILPQTILFDLIPQRMRAVWGPWIARTPVRTLTLAGAHSDGMFPFKKWFLTGFDDGVINMDSACARPMDEVFWPGGTWPSWIPSQWDRGMARDGELLRSLRYWQEQMTGVFSYHPTPQRAAAGCTPYKTPWGMVFQPIWGLRNQPVTFYPNHYAFIQTAENHTKLLFAPKDGMKGGEYPNLEDVRANGDYSIYTLNLVDPAMKNSQVESIKGRSIRFKLFGKKHRIYLWKRTYHRLDGWENQPAAEYIYRYVR